MQVSELDKSENRVISLLMLVLNQEQNGSLIKELLIE